MNEFLNSGWYDKANIPLLDGVFDDSLSDDEMEELRRYAEVCSDNEGW